MNPNLWAAFLLTVACSTILVAAEPEASPPSLWTRTAGSDWPRILGPTQDGKSSETGILKKWPQKGPRLVWQREVGTGYSVGSVAYGRFYQFDKVGAKATLVCLNAETGKELWKFDYASDYADLYGYNDGPRCAPVIEGNRVYLYGVEGMLHCLQATTGKLLWRFDTVAEFGVVQNFFGVGSCPIVIDNLLLVMVGGSPPESQRAPPGALNRVVPNDTAIVAFDKFTGEVRYKAGNDLASYASLQTMRRGNKLQLLAFCREQLLGIAPDTGKVEWEFPWRAETLESVNASTPVVVGNEVLISETYGPGSALLNLTSGSPKVVWQDDEDRRAKAMQTHWNTAIYHKGYLYGSSGRHAGNAELRCIEWKTGKVKWSQPRLSRTSLLYVDGHFVVLGEYGHLYLVRATPEKFELIAQVDYGAGGALTEGDTAAAIRDEPWWSAPILSHGLLYLRGHGRLLCLELIASK